MFISPSASSWNAEETINLLNNVIKPYVDQVIKKLGLPENQKALLIWDDFRGHTASNEQNLLPSLNITLLVMYLRTSPICFLLLI